MVPAGPFATAVMGAPKSLVVEDLALVEVAECAFLQYLNVGDGMLELLRALQAVIEPTVLVVDQETSDGLGQNQQFVVVSLVVQLVLRGVS